jgi:hypothetical protein
MSREHWAFSVVTDLSRFWPEYSGDRTVLRAEIGHADLLPAGVDTPDGQLITLVKRDLDRLYPEARALGVEWSRVHRETRHLYVEWVRGQFARRIRPEQRAPSPRLYLAGDWSSRGIIGMEAAANSGIEAANHVLRAAGSRPFELTDVPLR